MKPSSLYIKPRNLRYGESFVFSPSNASEAEPPIKKTPASHVYRNETPFSKDESRKLETEPNIRPVERPSQEVGVAFRLKAPQPTLPAEDGSELATQRTTRQLVGQPESPPVAENRLGCFDRIKNLMEPMLAELRKAPETTQLKLMELRGLRLWVFSWICISIFFDLISLGMSSSYSSEETFFARLTTVTTPVLMVSYYFVVKNPHLTKYCLMIIFVRLFLNQSKLIAQKNNLESLDTIDHILDVVVLLQRMNFLILCNIFNFIYFFRILERPWSRLLAVVAAGLPSLWMIINLMKGILDRGMSEHLPRFFMVAVTTLIQVGILMVSTKVNHTLLRLQSDEIKQKKQENYLFFRMIQSIKEAMIVCHEGQVTFKNRIAEEIFSEKAADHLPTSELHGDDVLTLPMLHIFKEVTEDSSKSSDALLERPQPLTPTKEVHSLADILEGRVQDLNSKVFTFRPEFANCENINQMQEIMSKLQKGQDGESTKFNFFLVKMLALSADTDESPEIVIQLIDISEKILIDGMSTERKYMAYMNSTVSHEMRNPLNSISSQLQLLKSLVHDLENAPLSPAGLAVFKEFRSKALSSMKTCQSSCRLLGFTVEDILALPQLKDGRFTKNIQMVSLTDSVHEIINILELQAKDKGTKISLEVSGFESSSARAFMDEKRFQQVLLNYVSNSLKFMNKRPGLIRIVLQRILSRPDQQATQAQFLKEQIQDFYGFDMLADANPWPEKDDLDMVALTVLDNGIGIKDEDQSKLFKLFGCLKSTRSMNTQGIGLGLVITRMITQEFGGNAQVFSRHMAGAVFQSTFEIEKPDSGFLLPKNRTTSSQLILTAQKARESSDMDSGVSAMNYKHRLRLAKRIQLSICQENFNQIRQCSAAFQYSNKKILIIDDEPFNCRALLSIFEVLKLSNVRDKVDVALSGAQALQLVAENIRDEGDMPKTSTLNKSVEEEKEPNTDSFEEYERQKPATPRLLAPRPGGKLLCDYSVILTDCSMPFMDGYECCSKIHDMLDKHGITDLEERPEVIAVTGHVEAEYQKKAVLAGMTHVYSKPIKVESVAQILLANRFQFQIPSRLNNKLIAE